jgi:hypothetical protein
MHSPGWSRQFTVFNLPFIVSVGRPQGVQSAMDHILMKRRSSVRISHLLSLLWTCQKKKKKRLSLLDSWQHLSQTCLRQMVDNLTLWPQLTTPNLDIFSIFNILMIFGRN